MNRKKLVICISGGMDSFIAYHYAIKEKKYNEDDILALHFDINQPYREKELKAMNNFGFPFKIINIDLIRKDLENIPTVKDYIIPARNMIFATIASGFGERVWIMGMKYENHKFMLDKNSEFFNGASSFLTQIIGEETIIESPFIEMTKTDSIKWALNNGITKEELMKTTSCYHSVKNNCGECSLCFKRWIAMKSAGIDEEFDTNPYESEEGKKLISNYRKALQENDFSHYQKDRILETLQIINNIEK